MLSMILLFKIAEIETWREQKKFWEVYWYQYADNHGKFIHSIVIWSLQFLPGYKGLLCVSHVDHSQRTAPRQRKQKHCFECSIYHDYWWRSWIGRFINQNFSCTFDMTEDRGSLHNKYWICSQSLHIFMKSIAYESS